MSATPSMSRAKTGGRGLTWRGRLAWGAAVAVVATLGYRGTQAMTVGEAVVRSDCATWRWVPFSAWWLVPYASMFVVMALPWFCLPVERLPRFGATVVAMVAAAWVVFVVHPTACVRPGADEAGWAYGVLIALDGPSNCLPCLHAALPVLAAWALATSGGWWSGRFGRALVTGWTALIALSILGVRQHTGVDVAAGLALGGAAVAVETWTRRAGGRRLARDQPGR